MDDQNARIDKILSEIEFPGEPENGVPHYLMETDFVNSVLKKVESDAKMSNHAFFWALFTLLDLVFLFILGTNSRLLNEYFAFDSTSTLNYLFFFFLSLSFLGGLCGLVVNLDTSWIKEFDYHDLGGLIYNLQKKIKHRLFK
jgi:hypothetical protein